MQNLIPNFSFDYGKKVSLMVNGDLTFAEYFGKAKCNGLVYMFNSINNLPIKVLFLMENIEFAKMFAQSIKKWNECSTAKNNAWIFEFCENDISNNGYVLGMTLNPLLLIERNIDELYSKWVLPYTVTATQFKELGTISSNYLKFKAGYPNVQMFDFGIAQMQNGIINEIDGYNFNVKNIQFYKQSSLPKTSNFDPYYKKTTGSELPIIRDSELEKERLSNIKYFFPITYEKIKNNNWLFNSYRELLSKYTYDIIIQAICNIIFQFRLTTKNITLTQINSFEILKFLVNDFESFDSYYPASDLITTTLIDEQIQIDKKHLEKE